MESTFYPLVVIIQYVPGYNFSDSVTLSDLESNYISRKPSILYSTIFPFDAIKKLFSASLGLNEPNRYGNIQFIIHYFHISCK